MMNKSMYSYLLILFLVSANSCKQENQNKYKVFTYNQINPVTSLDPAFAKSQNNIWAVNHIFDGLVSLDDNLNVSPNLAKSWEISEDGLIYSFVLEPNVYFHDDPSLKKRKRCTANDFVYSFNRLIDPKIASPGSWLFSDKVRQIKPFVAINDSIFNIYLKKPFRPFLGILAMEYCNVVPKESVEFYGDDFRSNPVGTGPFRFKKWLEDQALYLIKNSNYYQGVSHLDGIRTSFITDRKIAFLEFINGNIDFISGVESSFVNELLDKQGELLPERKSTIKLFKSPYLNFEYLGINQELVKNHNGLSNKLVRQALNYGINRELMLTALRNNLGLAANKGVIPKGLPSHDNFNFKGFSYDFEKAKSLLREAGFENGNGLDQIVITTNKDYLDLTTFVAKEWERLGLNVKVELLESAILRDAMRKSKIQLFRASWIADYPDGESFLCMFYGRNPAPPNYTNFRSAAYDKLYELSLKLTGDKDRFELYESMELLLLEEAPVIYLFYDQSALFVNKSVSNFQPNAINLLEVRQLEKQVE